MGVPPTGAKRREPLKVAKRRDTLKTAALVLCLLPLAWLAGRLALGGLGANPVEAAIRFVGDWALRLLVATLAVTPVRVVAGWPALARVRRTLGVACFCYATLHILLFVGLDQSFSLPDLAVEVVKRKFITVGMLTFLMLLPLAITSTDAMVRRLGGRRWRLLHRLAYPAELAAALHFYMMVKLDWREPLLWGVVLAVLLGWRLVRAVRPRMVAG